MTRPTLRPTLVNSGTVGQQAAPDTAENMLHAERDAAHQRMAARIARTTTLHDQHGTLTDQLLQHMSDYAPFPYTRQSSIFDDYYAVNVGTFLNSRIYTTGLRASYSDAFHVGYRLRKLVNMHDTHEQYIVYVLTGMSKTSVYQTETHYRLVETTPDYLAHGILLLLGKNELLSAALQHLVLQFNTLDTLGHRNTAQNAREVLTLYLAETWYDLAAGEPWDDTTPWSWHEPVIAQQVAHRLRNPQRLRDIYQDGLLTAEPYTVEPKHKSRYGSIARSPFLTLSPFFV